MVEIDNVDRGILYELQRNARDTTAQEIADKTGVSASTVRNRIDRLEEIGVIEGYYPKINYEAAGLPLQALFVCTADPAERSEVVDQLLGIRGVVEIRETITGSQNLFVEVVADDTSDMTRISDAIHALGLSVESSEILRQRRVQPFDHFQFDPPDALDRSNQE
jgi:Lrp/AsnC family leucine-responsive transcriptional regulator